MVTPIPLLLISLLLSVWKVRLSENDRPKVTRSFKAESGCEVGRNVANESSPSWYGDQ